MKKSLIFFVIFIAALLISLFIEESAEMNINKEATNIAALKTNNVD